MALRLRHLGGTESPSSCHFFFPSISYGARGFPAPGDMEGVPGARQEHELPKESESSVVA